MCPVSQGVDQLIDPPEDTDLTLDLVQIADPAGGADLEAGLMPIVRQPIEDADPDAPNRLIGSLQRDDESFGGGGGAQANQRPAGTGANDRGGEGWEIADGQTRNEPRQPAAAGNRYGLMTLPEGRFGSFGGSADVAAGSNGVSLGTLVGHGVVGPAADVTGTLDPNLRSLAAMGDKTALLRWSGSQRSAPAEGLSPGSTPVDGLEYGRLPDPVAFSAAVPPSSRHQLTEAMIASRADFGIVDAEAGRHAPIRETETLLPDVSIASGGTVSLHGRLVGHGETAIWGSTAAWAPTRQVADAVLRMRGNEAEIVLSPDELGKVRLVLSRGDSGPSLTVWVERPEVLEHLRRNADSLLADLRESGLDGSSLNFRDDADRQAPEDRKPGRLADGRDGELSAHVPGPADAVGTAGAARLIRLAGSNVDRLDIRV